MEMDMFKRVFGLAGMAELQRGLFDRQFKDGIKELMNDCAERPADNRARKLTMTVSIKPETTQGGELAQTKMAVSFKTNKPDEVTPDIVIGRSREPGGLIVVDDTRQMEFNDKGDPVDVAAE